MRLKWLISTQGLLLVISGIGFTLYAPLIMAYFQIPQSIEEEVYAYWQIAAFVRLFGVCMLGMGLILWAIHQNYASMVNARSIAFSLLLFNLMATVVALTQQMAVWSNLAGWVMTALFAMFSLGYLVVLARWRE